MKDIEKDITAIECEPCKTDDFSEQNEAICNDSQKCEINEFNVTELTPKQKKQRIWEVDFLRGFCILLVAMDHLFCDFMIVGMPAYGGTSVFGGLYDLAIWYWTCGWRAVIQPFAVIMFVFLSGISCSLSKSNALRSVKLAVIAGGMTVVLYLFYKITRMNLLIVFNVIHVLAICIAVWAVIELIEKYLLKRKLPWGILFGFALLSVLVGEVFKLGYEGYAPMQEDIFYPSYEQAVIEGGINGPLTWLFWNSMYRSADFYPLFPGIGYFLFGALFARGHYKNKTSLFPNAKTGGIKWICFCGRHTLWIYLGGQIVAYGIVYALAMLCGA